MSSIRQYRPSDEKSVIQLWRDCALVVPWNDPHMDIMRKAEFQPELFLVALDNDRVVGSVMAGYEGHRGWINYLAVAPSHQSRGIGTALMKEAERRLGAMGCPKINLQVRSNNEKVIELYRKIGFEVEDRVSMGKRLEPRN